MKNDLITNFINSHFLLLKISNILFSYCHISHFSIQIPGFNHF